ncbi:class I SAM-dependent methyltransferase [Paenibacillus timonensis]|uniref:Class I SAM-dependent methyltransferase n=1 Tax=Paenibacillus timonensis TaxID=225915 RepID=A0ABW3SGI0_9BACL|nr:MULTISPECIES: class I SAM-dependent methyltransferase [Paenibacillus]MCH1642151.1 class I SAM-dependent methyltransferase [Paenibacillus timonensis]MDU2240686.1 class I SAM-dependent methyltransferase [Paenibacillus sp.]
MKEIQQWYDNQYDEWERLERHKIEFDITKRYLDEYVTGDHLQVFDIGGGPGRYTIYLAEKGHQVTLLDLSKRHIEVAREKADERGVSLAGTIHGNALDLSGIIQTFDVILLMGPLYHLVKEADRKTAVEEALRHLKPGGLLVASFISNYAPLQDYLANLQPVESIDQLLGYLTHVENKTSEGFTTAYFTDFKEARSLMASFGLAELAFAGVENILGSKENEINRLTDDEYRKWLEIGYRLSQDENLMGTSLHFLYIGRK